MYRAGRVATNSSGKICREKSDSERKEARDEVNKSCACAWGADAVSGSTSVVALESHWRAWTAAAVAKSDTVQFSKLAAADSATKNS